MGVRQGVAGRNGAAKKPLVIGITGGMASGKTTLARMIAGRGIMHVDADKMVHYLLQQDRELVAKIAAAFPACVHKNKVDRAALAGHISNHPDALMTLEALIHPRVRAAELAAIDAAYRNRLRAVVLDVPLLFETDADQLCDVVVVAHAPLAHRRRRAFSRMGMTEEKWRRLLDRQLPDVHRNAAADIVISTAIGKAAMRKKIRRLMNEWGLL